MLGALGIKNMQSRAVTIRYRPFLSPPSLSHIQPKILDFPDAGFPGSLPVVLRVFMSYGRPLSGDGVIACEIHPILRGASKVRRVSRSSLKAEERLFVRRSAIVTGSMR